MVFKHVLFMKYIVQVYSSFSFDSFRYITSVVTSSLSSIK